MDQRYRLSWHERRDIEVPRHPVIKWLFGPKYISPWVHHSMIITGITVDREKINIEPEVLDAAAYCGPMLTYEPTYLPHCEGEGNYFDNPSFERVEDIWDGWTEENNDPS